AGKGEREIQPSNGVDRLALGLIEGGGGNGDADTRLLPAHGQVAGNQGREAHVLKAPAAGFRGRQARSSRGHGGLLLERKLNAVGNRRVSASPLPPPPSI